MEYNMETTNESTGSLAYTVDGQLIDLSTVTTDVQIKDGIVIQIGTTENIN
jgi:hypothetical protein